MATSFETIHGVTFLAGEISDRLDHLVSHIRDLIPDLSVRALVSDDLILARSNAERALRALLRATLVAANADIDAVPHPALVCAQDAIDAGYDAAQRHEAE